MHEAVIVCARCQPPTASLFDALAIARQQGRRVIMLCLNADDARGLTNPWSNAERAALLAAGSHPDNYELLFLRDRRYDRARWAVRATAAVAAALGDVTDVAVIADDDERSTSLPLPSTWQRLPHAFKFAADEAAARVALFAHAGSSDWSTLATLLSVAVLRALQDFARTAAFATLAAEATFIQAYRQTWNAAPYPPVFVTVDTLATWHDQILLIRRGRPPGQGLWALPGGFINQNECLLDACLRELAEETGVVLTPAAIKASQIFDDPLRSLRGRIITHAYHFVLDHLPAPPRAVGGDDAELAEWQPLALLSPEQVFDDHYFIVQAMLNRD